MILNLSDIERSKRAIDQQLAWVSHALDLAARDREDANYALGENSGKSFAQIRQEVERAHRENKLVILSQDNIGTPYRWRHFARDNQLPVVNSANDGFREAPVNADQGTVGGHKIAAATVAPQNNDFANTPRPNDTKIDVMR